MRLLWCSKSSGDTFWREWAARLAASYPGRFELVDTFTERIGTLLRRLLGGPLLLAPIRVLGKDTIE